MSTTTRKFKTVITDTGAKKLAQAAAPDGKPVRLTHMAVGDGGGTLPTPDSKQTRLVHEVWRHTVNRVILDATHQNRIIAELVIPPETGGFWIREIGVFDEHGDLIAVGNTAESYKPAVAEGSGRAQTFRTILTVSSTATVVLTVDNTMVMATVDYVDDKLKEHEQSRRHPDASLTAKGFTQLSSATNSESEILAATPKAVKAAYDLAAGKASASHTHPWNQITGVPAASLTVKGTVQLSSATNSTSETQAATPKAVKAAYDLAAGKAPVSHTHPWNQITDVPAASLTVKGTVQLSSATNSTSETQAATPKAVKAVYDLANGKQPADATLTALAGLATAADKLPYFTGNDTASLTTLTNVGRNILDKASTQAVIQYLGLSDASGYVGRWLNTRVFTSSGTYTPTPGTKRIRVTITGGGGGGGGCKAISNNETFFGAGGGAGGTIISIMTPTQNSYPVTIGAGGAGGVSATNGTSGGNSVFASLIAPGGAGGGKVGVTNTNGGNGGVPSTGDIRITGGNGGDGQSGNIGVSGEGGTSHWGGGGRAGAGGGVSGKAYGSGGGGAYDAGYSGTSMTGGKGAAGICIIEEFA